MENKVQDFLNEQFGEVRVVTINNEVWFVAKDICDILGTKTKDLPELLKNKGIGNTDILTNGGKQNMTIITEQSLYKVIFKSRKPFAEEFQDWICGVVIPAIRKDGSYISGEEDLAKGKMSEEEFILKAMTMMQNKIDRLNKENEEMKPKAEYHDNVLNPTTYNKLITMTEIAKDLSMSARKLNEKLHDKKVIYKVNGSWVLYSDYQNLVPAYFDYHITEHGQTLKATEKGRKYIIDLIKMNNV